MKQKLTLLLFLLIFSHFNLSAQDSVSLNDRFTNSTQFLFNNYTNAYIHLKNGDVIKTDINYNVFFQEIWYKNNNQNFILKDLEKVEYIELENFNLFVLNKMIYETIAYSNKYKILKHREINSESVNKNNGAYGMSTVTGSTESLSNFVTQPTTGVNKVNEISNKDVEFDVINRFYILDCNNGNTYVIAKRKLYQLFKNNKNLIKNFIKENDIDLRNEKDIIELFKYIVSL